MFLQCFKGCCGLKRKNRAPGRKSNHIILKLIKCILLGTCQVQCIEGNIKFNKSLIAGFCDPGG